MLPLCSAPTPSQVCLPHKAFIARCIMENKLHLPQYFLKLANRPPFHLPIATNAPFYSETLMKTGGEDDDLFAGIKESLSALVCNTDTAITNTFKTVTSSIDSSVYNLKLSYTTALSGLFDGSKGVSSRAGVVAVDGLRYAIGTVEELVMRGVMLAGYGYGSVKDSLPSEIQDVLDSLEMVLRPVGTGLRQVYIVFEGFERNAGVDPSDPIVPFAILLGTSAVLWVSYRRLTYGGYAGDLSPKLTLDLLQGKEGVALIDVRPEESRERDGIPDLRRGARFRYASVAFPEVDNNVKKVLKGGKDLEDALVAAVIRNLKVVQEGSKVVVMDADGSRSKGIARALRKVGIKRPYLVQGGFRSWVQEGLRVKEPKPETTFTILNEEAEAILEDVTPLQVIGYGVGFLAAAYALLEWETTLQLIAIFGISLTIYRRVASYENSKDFNNDVRQLLAPVKLGGQAISWAAGKLETNRNGLPTLPSSVNVQSRVLQAAAKHGSQPPDTEEQTTTTSISEA